MEKPRYEIYIGKDGKYYFSLVYFYADGQRKNVIYSNNRYTKIHEVINAISLVIKYGTRDKCISNKMYHYDGEGTLSYCFTVNQPNNAKLAMSGLYATEEDRDLGIKYFQEICETPRIKFLEE